MAGTIKVDSINADSNLALKIANTAVAFIDSSGLRPTSGNVSLDATATSKFYLPSANTVAIQTAGVTAVTVDSSQNVTLAGTLTTTGITNSGVSTATRFNPTGSSVTGNGMYLPAANSLGLSTNGTNAVYIDSSQKVGIGTSSPNANLQVNGGIQVTGTPTIGSTGVGVEIGYGLVNASEGAIQAYNRSGSAWINMAYSALVHKFLANNSEAMRITSAGKVGIGTTAPDSALHISGSAVSDKSDIKLTNTDSSGRSWRIGDGVGGNAGNLTFFDSTSGTSRMSIDSNGYVIVGGVSSLNSVFSVYGKSTIAPCALQVNANGDYGYVFKNSSGALSGAITVNASTVAYNTSSDYRLKENIAPMTGALAKVALLKPVTFKWKIDGVDDEGFIAHELQAVKPNCVTGAKDAVDADGNPQYQGIDTSFLVATLTAALQETKALIDTQAETINALTARIVALETI
jgi:hypothetical protein